MYPTGLIYNEHTNDLGDWCPWSGEPAPESDHDYPACPARCRDSDVVSSTDSGESE